MTVGYLAGAFDLLNVRDLDLIAQARQRCSVLLVGVFSDDVAARHGREPVVPLGERATLVSHVRGVDEVRVHDEDWLPCEVDITFAVAGEPLLPGGRSVWWLSPRRQTSSPVLQRALDRLPDEYVA